MPHITSEELHRTSFDGLKDLLKGSPILDVLLLFALTIGGAFLKSYLESIREDKPYQFYLILALLIVFGVFAFVMWISEF